MYLSRYRTLVHEVTEGFSLKSSSQIMLQALQLMGAGDGVAYAELRPFGHTYLCYVMFLCQFNMYMM